MPRVRAQESMASPVPYDPAYNHLSFPTNAEVHDREADEEPAELSISFSTWTKTKPAATTEFATTGDSAYTGVLKDVDYIYTTVSLAPGTTTTYSYATTISPKWPPVTTTFVPAPIERTPELPDWPPILTFFLFAWLGFAWLLATFLYFSQFPEQLEWLSEIVKKGVRKMKGEKAEGIGEDRLKRGRYVQLRDGGEDDVNDWPGRDAHAAVKHKERATTRPEPEGASTALPSGLGISISSNGGGSNQLGAPTIRLRKPRSFNDLDAAPSSETDEQTQSRGKTILTHLTAPLPTRSTFSPLSLSRTVSRTRLTDATDLENGLHTPGSSSSSSPDARDRLADNGKGGGLVAFLESVNAGIESMAGTMARMAYDHVGGEGAEEGLLLPVRQSEREHCEGLTSVG